MLATVHPEVGKSLIAQALANRQASGNSGSVMPVGYVKPVVSDATSAQNLQTNRISNASPWQSAADSVGSALSDFYHQTILQAGKDISGYVTDAVNDPAAFAHAMGPSVAGLSPIASEVPAVVRGVFRLFGLQRPLAESDFGDLSADEIQRIQSVVNEAGRPLEVVGSAARGSRTAASDIDYVIPHSSVQYYKGLQGKLPGVDPEHGVFLGVGNPNIGPSIRFEPK